MEIPFNDELGPNSIKFQNRIISLYPLGNSIIQISTKHIKDNNVYTIITVDKSELKQLNDFIINYLEKNP